MLTSPCLQEKIKLKDFPGGPVKDLPVHGTWVQSLVTDPTCHGATKPLRHN